MRADLAQRVEAVRSFNRFYTKKIGVLNAGFLSSPFSLSEVRVLYELAHRPTARASDLSRDLDMDAGQLSRMLRGFEKQGIIGRRRSDVDARQTDLFLTDQGQEAFAALNQTQSEQVAAMLDGLSPVDQDRVVAAMGMIEGVLGERPDRRAPYLLRPHRPGDMGWVVQRHGELYWQEYGWDERFEGLVAGIVSDFLKEFDPKRECCWIAERDGQRVGSVLLVRASEGVAKLRLFLVEPSARGMGIGKRLVEECTRFARQAGYRKITLWTNDVLVAARHIYTQAGYRMVHAEPHDSWGHNLVSET
ncbi:MAG TPA: helix-turn-helix domain-containing GNAT family N-acetyltransferase, partial [Symbiobacteriaceae bacterium]|nr:helix-turn-helix domain-containing GNAT family N-acetyltransferase [Symbiobacteriaceae bacterium]